MRCTIFLRTAIITIVMLVITPLPAQSLTGELMQVHFIDVGQGDSILIETPADKTILIDGGPPDAGKTVVNYLESLDIETIDLLIATHPDVDHIGGLPRVMKSFNVRQVIDSGKLHTTYTYTKYINEIWNREIPVEIANENETIKIDPLLEMKILNSYDKRKNNNQSSIVLKITYGEIDFLLMGDVEMEQEHELMGEHNVQAEILKIAHHGSNTSTSRKFLQKVNPQIAMLTYSVENDYGHPVNRVIENLHKQGSSIYSTAAFGNVVLTTDGKNYMVIPERTPFGNLEKAG
ncbi:ComEC/Rec2 family competence protein [Lentibacillus sediminis]|uniref:ComEC/Rec2 family competence protein n=1 Tax=Lentibacillus sediminis TaxID=1940529 RepID=UPI000C1C17CD|nr:MBL fold metallo-hydrolase [Lentibacillus sediminis]